MKLPKKVQYYGKPRPATEGLGDRNLARHQPARDTQTDPNRAREIQRAHVSVHLKSSHHISASDVTTRMAGSPASPASSARSAEPRTRSTAPPRREERVARIMAACRLTRATPMFARAALKTSPKFRSPCLRAALRASVSRTRVVAGCSRP